jgi:hypothetical protein
MAIILFIALFLCLLYEIFRNRRTVTPSSSSVDQLAAIEARSEANVSPAVRHPKAEMVIERRLRIHERKTYIRGILLAKFNGELDYIKDLKQFVRERFFDILLYDARIGQTQFRRNNEGPFQEEPATAAAYQGTIEPNPLPCTVTYEGIEGEFTVLLQDVRLYGIDFNKYRILHMEEDDLVFGMVEATITGYILEHFREEFEVEVPVAKVPNTAAQGGPAEYSKSTAGVEPDCEYTGRTKTENGYRWREYWSIGRRTAGWGDPLYIGGTRLGCGGLVGIFFSIFLGFVFLLALGPEGVFVLLVLAAGMLAVGFFSSLIRPLLWGLGAILLVMGVAAITNRVIHGPDRHAVAFSHDLPSEMDFVVRERSMSRDSVSDKEYDSIIVHHRIWKDYDDSTYEGNIWIRRRDMARSGAFKSRLIVPHDPYRGYDGMLSALQANDRSLLPGVFQLLDSIRLQRHLDRIALAKVVVAFVQDIPYSIVLDKDCNPDLYSDPFTRRYLQTADASCSGDQRFGINTPVEFMGTLKGDCDTRTLLLYTLLDHYGYDVAILSSEVFSHSLLGIVLAVPGDYYSFNDKNYILWETTTAGMPPGVIAPSLNIISNWRVSLTSKPRL